MTSIDSKVLFGFVSTPSPGFLTRNRNTAQIRAKSQNKLVLATSEYGYNSHILGCVMRSVNIAELKNQLSKYLTFAKSGEEIVIRDRNLPVAKLVPFSSDQGSEEDLLLVAAGKMRLPKNDVKFEELVKIRTGKVPHREGTRALLSDREESL
jgi:prevent-host-death family protein